MADSNNTITDVSELDGRDFDMMGSSIKEELDSVVEFVSQREEKEEDQVTTVITYTSPTGIESVRSILDNVQNKVIEKYDAVIGLSWSNSDPHKIEVVFMGGSPVSDRCIVAIRKLLRPLASAAVTKA